MAKDTPNQVVTEDLSDFTLDMTQAKTFEPLPERKALLASISKWEYGRTAKGKKLDYEFTVSLPTELANRKIPESLSLENEYTLGRYKNMLIALGFPEEEVTSPNHKPPKSEDVLGMEATVFCKTRRSDTFGDRSQISRFRPASAYEEVSATY